MTAWIGVRRVAKPEPGDTFVVSAAAGAVGSIAGQIAKRDGARVIGIAGGPAKVQYLITQLGFDAAIDYKNEDVNSRLRELAPDGVNVFFDNVGGPILDAVLDNLAMRAKVVICGAISQYDDMDNVTGPSMYLRLAERQSSMEGYAYFHFPESIAPATAELAAWLADGSLLLLGGDPRRHRAIPRGTAVHVRRREHRQAARQGQLNATSVGTLIRAERLWCVGSASDIVWTCMSSSRPHPTERVSGSVRCSTI